LARVDKSDESAIGVETISNRDVVCGQLLDKRSCHIANRLLVDKQEDRKMEDVEAHERKAKINMYCSINGFKADVCLLTRTPWLSRESVT
jgi:hypothetical protein